jgi:predicted Zn-dependent peptidase
MDHQTNGRIAWYLGWWELMGHGHAYDARYPGVISAVTAEAVHAAAQDLLSRPAVTVSVVPASPGR